MHFKSNTKSNHIIAKTLVVYSWALFYLVTPIRPLRALSSLTNGAIVYHELLHVRSARSLPIELRHGTDGGPEERIEALAAVTMSPLTVGSSANQSWSSKPSSGSSSSTTTSPMSATTTDTTTDTLNDGLCRIQMLSRRLSTRNGGANVTERALICSQIEDKNYRHMVASFYRRNKLVIQQIHIAASEPLVVFPAIDLICERFDCSRLTVFNVTGQRVDEFNKLIKCLSDWPQLEVLDLSNTSLASIESIVPPVDSGSAATVAPGVGLSANAHQLKNLTHLHLDENNITILNFTLVFERMPNLRQLTLVNNSIYDVYCNENLRSRLRSQLEAVHLAGNAVNCDKTQLWLMKLFQNSLTNLKFPDHDRVNCSAPKHLVDMTWPQRINVHETKICDECSCQSLKRTAIQVDCHRKNLSSLPDVLPLNTRVLNLTSNRIGSLGVPLNSRNWENVTYLFLEDNLISSFQQLNSKFMRNLAALDIRRNRFQEFPSHILEQFVNLDQVHLSNNPWLCDCESTFALQEWLQRHFHQVSDKEEIRCGVSGSEQNGLRSIDLQQRLSSRVIYKLSKSELCPQDIPFDTLDMVNLVLGLAIFLTLTKVVVDYFYQRRTKRLPHFFKLNI